MDRDNNTGNCEDQCTSYMSINISTGDCETDENNCFSVDTDAQKVIAMHWLSIYLYKHCDGWSMGYYHGADEECLFYSDEVTHFAIPLTKDAQCLAFYDKVATKALSDPDQWHPVAKHLPETMSIEFGVMYR